MPDDAVLTQFGYLGADEEAPFHAEPREKDAGELSLLWGVFSAEKAAVMIGRNAIPGRDAARYCTAGALRAAGFTVTNTPTLRNPDHISVQVPGGAVEWDDRQKSAFAQAFAEHETQEV